MLRRDNATRQRRTVTRRPRRCVQEYIDQHGISKTVEEVINATVKAKAPEPNSFMARGRPPHLPSCSRAACLVFPGAQFHPTSTAGAPGCDMPELTAGAVFRAST